MICAGDPSTIARAGGGGGDDFRRQIIAGPHSISSRLAGSFKLLYQMQVIPQI